MDNHNGKTVMEKVSDDIDEVHDVKGVQAEPTPAASSLPASEQVPLPIGKNINKSNYINDKIVRYRFLIYFKH